MFDDPNASLNILPRDGEVFLHPAFLNREDSDEFFSRLLKGVKWKQEKIRMYGKVVNIPRSTAWYGDTDKEYTYSGIKLKPIDWTNDLLSIKKAVEERTKTVFSSVLLNLYRNGDDSVAWHSDDEEELGMNPTIASVSLGSSRTFRLRHLEDKSLIRTVELTHGSLLIMQGETQHKWEHEIPKKKSVIRPRINLTFRAIKA